MKLFLRWTLLICALLFTAAPAFAGGYDFGKIDKNTSPSDWGDKLEGDHSKDWNVDTTPSGAMFQILTEMASLKPDPSWYKNACERAAINAAWDIWGNGQGTGIAKAWGQAFKDIGSNLWGLAGSGVEEYVADQIKDGVKGKLKDKIQDFLKGKKVKSEVFKMSGTRGNCSYVMYVVADPVRSTVDVLISGNCGCKLQRCYDAQQSAMLAAFAIHLQASFNYKVGNDKIEGITMGTFRKIFFKADCDSCKEKESTTVAPPPPAAKTCPPCQEKGDDLEEALTRRDNLMGEQRNVQNKIMDAEREGGDTSKLEARNKAIDAELKKLDAKIKELEAKKESCEKKKCGVSYDEPVDDGEVSTDEDYETDTGEEVSTDDNNATNWLGGFSVGVGMGHRTGRHGDDHGSGGAQWCPEHHMFHSH